MASPPEGGNEAAGGPPTDPHFLGTATMDEVIRRTEAKTCISLFTGAGGFDLGTTFAGFETRAMVEWSHDCCQTLRHNFFQIELMRDGRFFLDPQETRQFARDRGASSFVVDQVSQAPIEWYHDREPAILERDIRTLPTSEILEAAGLQVGECSLITGSPPCQGFSTANTRRRPEDPRNSLYLEMVRVVREALPRAFILENVPGLVHMSKGAIICAIADAFAGAGYQVTWDVLNAANYGVPQTRKRVIMIGKRIDILRVTEEGRLQLYMAAYPGQVRHPDWFRKTYHLPDPKQSTLEDCQPAETIDELLRSLCAGKRPA